MDLSVIDQLQGGRRDEGGLKWQAQALAGERVFSTNRRGQGGQKRLLVFAEPSDMGGAIPPRSSFCWTGRRLKS